MKTVVIALCALTLMICLGMLALTYLSMESQVTRQFKKQYPSYSIDHIGEDGNVSGAYYIVWYKDPKSGVIESAFCRQTGNFSWVCNLSSP